MYLLIIYSFGYIFVYLLIHILTFYLFTFDLFCLMYVFVYLLIL